MEFSLSAEQRELKEAAADFARAKLNEDFAKRQESGEFPLEAQIWSLELPLVKFGTSGQQRAYYRNVPSSDASRRPGRHPRVIQPGSAR